MPEYLIPKGGDQDATNRLRKLMVMMDSMNNAELDGKIDFKNYKTDPNIESRIRRIAAGSGSHPNEVKMLLQVHRQFEGMVSKMGKSGLMGAGGKKAQLQQQQLAAQLRKNPNLISQRINQMDPQMVKQMGGREKVMAMMQQFAKSGGTSGGGPGGFGGGMPNMDAMQAMMQGMGGGGGGGMPNMDAMQAMMQGMGGGAGGMPNMDAMQAMMQGMGGGAGGFSGGAAGGGAPGGMDMKSLMRMAEAMRASGMLPPGMQLPPTSSRR
jgi:signal recognition particle subunit SRP54